MRERGHFKMLTRVASGLMSFMPKGFASLLYRVSKNAEGSIPMGLRYICIKRLAKKCGKNVAIFPYFTLKHIDNMTIGDNVSIHTMCYLDALGGINIGDNVSIAHQCSLVSFDHTYTDIDTPIKYNNVLKGRIEIKNDVWIGCAVRILQGVTIGPRSIVAAGAVVTKDVERNCLYGGVPAKAIKKI